MRKIFICIVILICSFSLFAQMPAHPELLKRIERGEIDKSILPDYKEMREKGIDAAWADVELSKANSDNTQQRMFGPSKPYAGKLNTLVILVTFPDNAGKDNPSTFDRVLFSTNPGSMNSYFKEVSYGKVDMVTEDLPSKIGWIMAPHPYSYYVGTGKGTGTYPKNSQGLAEDIVKKVDSLIDFSKYDNNGDKKVDAILFVHAGPGAEFSGASSTQIWSHAWSTRSSIAVDGVSVSKYSIEPEYLSRPGDITIGVFCHELGHALFGLPDLYDTDNSSEGLGNWSLMAGGSWNGVSGTLPAHMEAWCKMQCGFAVPIAVTKDSLSFEMPNAEFNPNIYRMWKNGQGNKEFFLIENRQKTGFDAGLPNSGLCIFHVDNNMGGNTNEWYPGHTSSGHFRVAMIQADGQYTLERNGNRGDEGDPYPGSTKNNTFNSVSFPSSLDYTNNFTNIAFHNITEKNGIINLDLFVNDNLNPAARLVNFLPHELNQPADTLILPVTNTGLDTIFVTNIKNQNSAYKLMLPAFPKIIPPGGVYKLAIIFNPETVNIFTDTITITRANSYLNNIKIAVSGMGFVLSPASERTIYGISGNLNGGKFLTIDKSSGAGKNIGASGYTDIVSMAVNPKTKNLYGLHQVTADSAKIAKINPLLGDSYSFYSIKIGNLAGIAFDTSGALYAATKTGSVYKVDIENGTFKKDSSFSAYISAIAFNPVNNQLWGSQYAVMGIRDNIYKLDLKTGNCTTVGRTGMNSVTRGLFFDESGKLYGTAPSSDQTDNLLLIDKNTGSADIIGSTGLSHITGLAYLPGKLTTGVAGYQNTPVGNFSLMQNYPNPFNPSTLISYNIPQNGNAKLTVYNLLGQQIKTLFEGAVTTGNYQAVWNADNAYGQKVSAGVYFYELKFNSENGNSFTDKKKMILVK